MKKLIKFIIGIVLMIISVIGILLTGTLLPIIFGGLIFLIGLIFFYKNLFFWKSKESEVPQEIVDEFNLFERRLKEQGGNEEPKDASRLLWDRYRETAIGRKPEISQLVESERLHGQPSGREDLPNIPASSNREKYRGDKQSGTFNSGSNKPRPRRKIRIFKRD